ncbi:hypothetical protein [Streptomyces sp. CAI-85]|uniref:hypothetical protein n=1 Tax=Streptomyces sp. CAI-85 TaxID=1472662 RepID=UPI00158792DF|nr:hypothetical protein [Streptomyces sp. CAI-85]NUV62311.1 hypothetical protein [Streptomyces sp. CAI-85]
MLFILLVLALLASCAACALAWALTARVKKVIGATPDVASIRSAAEVSVEQGTRIAGLDGLVDVAGEPFSLPVGSAQPWVLAFQSLGCAGCRQQLPGYRKFLEEHGVPAERAISLAIGDPADLGWLRSGLDGVGRVVHVDQNSPVVANLQISHWPTYLVVGPDDRVLFSTRSSARLTAPDPRNTVRASAPAA